MLPGGTPALVRADGEILLGVQMQTSSDDVSRDIGTALAAALEAPAGARSTRAPSGRPDRRARGCRSCSTRPRRSRSSSTTISAFWLEGTDPSAAALAGLEHANEAILPTVRLSGLEAAYWVRPSSERAHLRWVRPEPEEKLLDALARLSASEQILLGEGTRYAGAFRALGLVVPVWDLPADTPAEDWVEPGDGVPDPPRAGARGDRSADLRRAARPGRAALPADHAPLTASGREACPHAP